MTQLQEPIADFESNDDSRTAVPPDGGEGLFARVNRGERNALSGLSLHLAGLRPQDPEDVLDAAEAVLHMAQRFSHREAQKSLCLLPAVFACAGGARQAEEQMRLQLARENDQLKEQACAARSTPDAPAFHRLVAAFHGFVAQAFHQMRREEQTFDGLLQTHYLANELAAMSADVERRLAQQGTQEAPRSAPARRPWVH